VAYDGSSPAAVATHRRPSFFGRLAWLAGALPDYADKLFNRVKVARRFALLALDFATMRLESSAMDLVSTRNPRSHLNMRSFDAARPS
jgi:hypothetical protein